MAVLIAATGLLFLDRGNSEISTLYLLLMGQRDGQLTPKAIADIKRRPNTLPLLRIGLLNKAERHSYVWSRVDTLIIVSAILAFDDAGVSVLMELFPNIHDHKTKSEIVAAASALAEESKRDNLVPFFSLLLTNENRWLEWQAINYFNGLDDGAAMAALPGLSFVVTNHLACSPEALALIKRLSREVFEEVRLHRSRDETVVNCRLSLF